eukprot:7344485-Pyramimonas_sp.AAC.1
MCIRDSSLQQQAPTLSTASCPSCSTRLATASSLRSCMALADRDGRSQETTARPPRRAAPGGKVAAGRR